MEASTHHSNTWTKSCMLAWELIPTSTVVPQLSCLCSTGITNFIELCASNLGLIRIAANLSGPGPFHIEMGGSTAVISLPQSTCPQQEQPGTPKLAGLWNVLTTTSMSSLTADRLAYLVLQHTQYHRCVTGNVFL